MKTLWFKQQYVAPILSGQKVDTIRRAKSLNLFSIGECISASVGPRTPFAILRILGLNAIDIILLAPERQHPLHQLYPGETVLTRISFQVVEECIPK